MENIDTISGTKLLSKGYWAPEAHAQAERDILAKMAKNGLLPAHRNEKLGNEKGRNDDALLGTKFRQYQHKDFAKVAWAAPSVDLFSVGNMLFKLMCSVKKSELRIPYEDGSAVVPSDEWYKPRKQPYDYDVFHKTSLGKYVDVLKEKWGYKPRTFKSPGLLGTCSGPENKVALEGSTKLWQSKYKILTELWQNKVALEGSTKFQYNTNKYRIAALVDFVKNEWHISNKKCPGHESLPETSASEFIQARTHPNWKERKVPEDVLEDLSIPNAGCGDNDIKMGMNSNKISACRTRQFLAWSEHIAKHIEGDLYVLENPVKHAGKTILPFVPIIGEAAELFFGPEQ
jgi:hypothetical protein